MSSVREIKQYVMGGPYSMRGREFINAYKILIQNLRVEAI
jgi:hypothetical protein